MRALVLACLLATALLTVEMRTTGRARPPAGARASAIAAFEAASRGPAASWAPEAVRRADAALREALLDWSRQENRLLPLRDFRPVAGRLAGAEALAREAGRLGGERRSEGRKAAEDAVEDARAVEAQAALLVAATSLPHSQRAHLQRARLLLLEAEALLREGEVVSARERASQSRTELREAVGPALEAAERYTSREQVATWRRWIDETRAWSRSTGQPAILVLKEKNLLVLLSKGVAVRTYDAEVGSNALGVKSARATARRPRAATAW